MTALSSNSRLFILLFLGAVLYSPYAFCDNLIKQKLDLNSSDVRFDVNSKALNCSGSFTNYKGELLLNPQNVEESKVALSLDLQSVMLPPDQVLQALMIQTVLQKAGDPIAHFQSTAIRKSGTNKLLIDGAYSWRNKKGTTTIPVQIVKLSPSLSQIKFLLNGTARSKELEVPGLEPGQFEGAAESRLTFRAN